jgi:hypothetical protein
MTHTLIAKRTNKIDKIGVLHSYLEQLNEVEGIKIPTNFSTFRELNNIEAEGVITWSLKGANFCRATHESREVRIEITLDYQDWYLITLLKRPADNEKIYDQLTKIFYSKYDWAPGEAADLVGLKNKPSWLVEKKVNTVTQGSVKPGCFSPGI